MAVTTFANATTPNIGPQRSGAKSAKIASLELINRSVAAGYVMTVRDPAIVRGVARAPVIASGITRNTAATVGASGQTISATGKDVLLLRNGQRVVLKPPYWHRSKYVTILSFFRSYVIQPPGDIPYDPGAVQADEPRKWPKDYIKRLFPSYAKRWNQQ